MVDWISSFMMIPIFFMMEMGVFSSPMNVLIFLLLMVWFMSVILLMLGGDVWLLIYMIMLFNGGLMILYLFIISMIPKEKTMNLYKSFNKMIILFFIVLPYFDSVGMESYMMMNFSVWVLITLLIFIIVFSLIIFSVMMDVFKTMKSSF